MNFPPTRITTTIITFEEQMRGWMSYLAKMRSIDEQVLLTKRSNNISTGDFNLPKPERFCGSPEFSRQRLDAIIFEEKIKGGESREQTRISRTFQ